MAQATRKAKPRAKPRAKPQVKPERVPPPAPVAEEMHTEAELETFLDHIRQGIGRHLAAQAIGSTGVKMRRLCRPERDPEFAARYEEAAKEGTEFYRERLAAHARKRALTDDSDRILEVELATHHPEYEHLRRDRVKVEGAIRHEHELVIRLDRTAVEAMPLDELKTFREQVARLTASEHEVVDAEPRELPPAEAAA